MKLTNIFELRGKTIESIDAMPNKYIQDNENCTTISDAISLDTAILHFTDNTLIMIRYAPLLWKH